MPGIASLLSQFEGFGGDNAVTAPIIQRRSAPVTSTPTAHSGDNDDDSSDDGNDYEMPTTMAATNART